MNEKDLLCARRAEEEIAHIHGWDFSNLLQAQKIPEETGAIEARIHRFLLVAQKQ